MVKVQTAEKVISRARLHSLLNPNERSQPRYNDCTDNHRINSSRVAMLCLARGIDVIRSDSLTMLESIMKDS